jgi:hypothetical protein
MLESGDRRRGRGQILVLFAGSLVAIILAIGLVVDGGNALAQRRGAQNAADFGAMAGARVIAEWVGGDLANGTDANVRDAITNAVVGNGGVAPVYLLADSPQYVNSNGAIVGAVGNGVIPASAAGVTVGASRSWRPYFLGIVGVSNWTASANATAKGGYCLDCAPPPGTLFPVGIAQAYFTTYQSCSGPVSNIVGDPCYPVHLTPGNLNVPGGFGWLKFGCAGFGLGQGSNGGCDNNKPFLQTEIGPPSDSFGCCTAVGQGGLDRIGSLPGNKVSADCSYYIDNQIVVTVPIWDTAGGTGSNGWYHIIGFAGFQLTACEGGKDIEGVWRRPFFTGPTTTTAPVGNIPAPLAIQLVR